MKRPQTLKSKVQSISIGAFLLSAILMVVGFIVYTQSKQLFAEKQLDTELRRNSRAQVEQIIPSFLLPEQMAGISLLLDRIKNEEDLTQIKLLSSSTELPNDYSECSLIRTEVTKCQSKNKSSTAIMVPVIEGDHHFGWLLKARSNSSAIFHRELLQMFGLFIVVLVLTFLILHFLTTRILSLTLPKALDDLVSWIDADLSDRSIQIPALPFKELEDLKEKVSEILERHTRERDQAIVGQLTSGIMHDIRTPMQSVVSAMHLVERSPEGDSKREARLENLYVMAKQSIPLISKIIESTLDGSRQIAVNKMNTDLIKTIRDSISRNSELINLRNTKINLKGPDSLLTLHDPVHIGRVISNLLKNAMEAVSDEKNPIINILVRSFESGRVQLIVEDNGSGFVKDASRSFRVFRSSKIHGSGLGLHISKKIIEAHSGSIKASNQSSLGGAHIALELPESIIGRK